MRDTRQKIMDASMRLVIEKGYSDTTTLDIAKEAGVNEATLFRRFGSKKEIVLSALESRRWVPVLDTAVFSDAQWELAPDLERFMLAYYRRVTPEIVKLSIGLRSPQIYADTAPYIMKVPVSYLSALEGYFKAMQEKGRCKPGDAHAFAITLFSATLGFVFLQASFGKTLSDLEQEAFIKTTVETFANGLQ